MNRVAVTLCAACLLLLSSAAPPDNRGTAGAGRFFTTNEDFVEGLWPELNLRDPKEVFRFVFANLRDEVNVYPTENYYYFQFAAQGRFIKGNVALFAHGRDRGELSFSYDEASSGGGDDTEGAVVHEGALGAADGVSVKRVTPFRYAVTFEGRTVFFNLNQVEQRMPAGIRLTRDEVFVGQSFDESGVRFLLVFDRRMKHLFWVLNDEGDAPEPLTPLTRDIYIGGRTGFAFYSDTENARKILIGVSEEEVRKNSWYDGPFDQLPDNYIASGEVEVKKYLEAAYPYAKGKMDKFGVSLEDAESRVAVCSYLRYGDTSELKELVEEASKRAAGKRTSEFYCELTGL